MDRFDFTDGDFCMNMGGGMMMDTEGHMMQDMGGRNGNGFGVRRDAYYG